jgi:hypothetical protein
MVAIALTLITTGCAVGNFVTGAPSSRSMTPTRALLVRRCSGCHRVPEPAAMSAAAWQAALERMKQRMRLPSSEWDSLAAMPALGVHH